MHLEDADAVESVIKRIQCCFLSQLVLSGSLPRWLLRFRLWLIVNDTVNSCCEVNTFHAFVYADVILCYHFIAEQLLRYNCSCKIPSTAAKHVLNRSSIWRTDDNEQTSIKTNDSCKAAS